MKKPYLFSLLFFIVFAFANSGKIYSQTYTQLNMSSGLPTNDFSCIKGISPINVWVGTFDFGVGHYNGSSWQFFDTTNSPMPDNYIHDIEVDKSGKVWFGTAMGVASYDGTNWNVLDSTNSPLFTIDAATPLQTPEGYSFYSYLINEVEIDTSGRVWIASFDRLIRVDSSGYSVYNLPYDVNYGIPNMGDSMNAILEFDINQKSNNMIVSSPFVNSIFYTYNNLQDKLDTLGYTLAIPNSTYFGIPFVAVADSVGVWAKMSYTDYVGYNNYGGTVSHIIFDSINDVYWDDYDSTICFLEGNPANAAGYGRIFLDNSGVIWASNVNVLSSFDGSAWTPSGLSLVGNISGIDVDSSGYVYLCTGDSNYGISWMRNNSVSDVLSSDGIIIYYPEGMVGIEGAENNKDGALMYPMPVSDKLNVKSNAGIISQVVLLDLSGRVVLEINQPSKAMNCDFQKIMNGYYTVRIAYTNGEIETRKIVVQH